MLHVCAGVGVGSSKHPSRPQAKVQGQNQGIQNERDQGNASVEGLPC